MNFTWAAGTRVSHYVVLEVILFARRSVLLNFHITAAIVIQTLRNPIGRVPIVVEKEKGVFSRYPKNNWLME